MLLLKRDGEVRNPEVRNEVKRKYRSIDQTKETNSKAVVETDKIMTRTRYKNYRVMWDDYEAQEAFDEFDQLHAEQSGTHDDEDGNERVAMEDMPSLVKKRKTSHSTIAITERDSSSYDEFNRQPRNLPDRDPQGAGSDLPSLIGAPSSFGNGGAEICPDDSISIVGSRCVSRMAS